MSGDQLEKLVPIANVGRIMKKILPPSAKISKEAKERMQECATEFISFVTGEASERCHKENRKTLNGDDVCRALTDLGFDNYSEAMLKFLQRFREYERKRTNEGNTDHQGTASFDFEILQTGRTSTSSSGTIFFNQRQDLNSPGN